VSSHVGRKQQYGKDKDTKADDDLLPLKIRMGQAKGFAYDNTNRDRQADKSCQRPNERHHGLLASGKRDTKIDAGRQTAEGDDNKPDCGHELLLSRVSREYRAP